MDNEETKPLEDQIHNLKQYHPHFYLIEEEYNWYVQHSHPDISYEEI